MTEQVEQGICIKFCVKLEHSSWTVETVQMIQKAAAMGSWWVAASSWHEPTHTSGLVQSFSSETSNHPRDSAPYSPDLVPCNFWLFPKLKPPLKGERGRDFRPLMRFREIWGSADGDWEHCVRSRAAYFEGDWGVIVLYTVFLVSCISFNNVFIFPITWLDTFWTDLVFLLSQQPVARVESKRSHPAHCPLLGLVVAPYLDAPECHSSLEVQSTSGKQQVRMLSSVTSRCDAVGRQEHGDSRCCMRPRRHPISACVI